MRTRAWWTTLSLVVAAGACGDQPTAVVLEPDVALSVASVALDPATKLAFGQQPTTTTSMLTISPPVTVRVLDAANALVTTSTVPVTLALGNNPAGGTLSGTLTKNAVNGVATFSDLSLAKAGTGYTLRASGPGLTSASSATFVIFRGPASRLRFVAQPTGGDPGKPFPVQPRVAVEDAGGNLASSGSGAASNISLALVPGSGPGGAQLSCTGNPLNATAGVAAFTGCALDLAAAGYRLRATSGTLSPAVTDPFAVGARPPVVSVGGPYGVAEGSALSLTPDVSDPDGDPLTYHWTVATTGLDAGGQCTFDDATAKNARITCTDDSQGAAGGKFLLTLEASDGTGTAVASADLTVSNAAPAIARLTGPGGAALPATIVVGGTLDLWAPFGDAGGNDHHAATIQCDAGAGVSGLGAVISPLAAGCTFDAVGARTIGVRVTDDDGGWANATHTVTVVYGLEGFFAPVRRPNALNLYRAGQAIPLKWRLTDVEGEPITTLTGVTVRATGVTCPQGTTTDQVQEYPTGGSGLRNLGGGYYQLNWKTPASYASSCKSVALEFAPGYRTGTLARFTFKP